jgi:NAD(P)-dependent dehydrogenase (short-subunit alcohol dehydrogenase family)
MPARRAIARHARAALEEVNVATDGGSKGRPDRRSTGRLGGKVAIVTGGASGMGLATVKRFVDEGACVVVGDVQREPGARLARELGDRARFRSTDVARESDVEALVAFALDEFGRLDCMFNNAGFGGVAGELVDLDLGDAYRNTIDVLFTGVLAGVKHAARVMKRRGAGSIINTASVAGLRGGYGPHVYSAMKSAVVSLSRTAALELGANGIRVNAICPGFIATAIFAGQRNWSYETRQRFVGELENFPTTTPIRRAGLGPDIAAMALYLASDESAFVTGQQFVVDGGLMAGNPPDPSRRSDIQELADRIESE